MIPAGYMLKRIAKAPEWLECSRVHNIYSVSGCISKDFADYINYWKHNRYWFFDSQEIIYQIALQNKIQILNCEMLYYEIYEKEYDGEWKIIEDDFKLGYNVEIPKRKEFLGYDIVSYIQRNKHECSPLSCNNLCKMVDVNENCLLDDFEITMKLVESLDIKKAEPGPYRIISVNKVGVEKV